MSHILEVIFILIACFFAITASLGVLRFPDFYTRMHSAGKVSSFGIGFILLALVVKFPEAEVITKGFLCLFFIVLTTPISAHLLMRVAYRLKIPVAKQQSIDEYQDSIKS